MIKIRIGCNGLEYLFLKVFEHSCLFKAYFIQLNNKVFYLDLANS